MIIFSFQSTKEPDMFGYTVEASGPKLPLDGGPWRRFAPRGVLQVGPSDVPPQFIQSGPIFDGIKSEGYYVMRGATDDSDVQ